MAPAAATKKRENLHTDIGFVGRKTGFTVQTDLARDDNGMENMSAFFSPTSNAGTLPNADDDSDDDSFVGEFRPDDDEEPEIDEEPPRNQPVTAHDDSASMDMEDSTARSVAAVLESRKGINTPARRKSMHSTHATPNIPLSSVTPQSNLSTPAIRRPQLKGTAKAPSSQLSKPSTQDEETRDSYGSHKENVPNSIDSRKPKGAPADLPAPRSVALGARASGLRPAGGRGGSMLVAKGLKQARTAISPPQDSDSDVQQFDEEPTLEDSEIEDIPPPQPKTTQRPAPQKNVAEPDIAEESSQKAKPGRKGKAIASKTTDDVEKVPAKNTEKSAPSKRARKTAKPSTIPEDVSEPEIVPVEEPETLDAEIPDMEAEEIVENAAEPSPPKKGKGVAGRKKKQIATDMEVEETQPSSNSGQKKKGGRPKKIVEPEPEPELEEEPEPEPAPAVQKSKGRPKKSRNQDAPATEHDVGTQEEPSEEQSQLQNSSERKRGRKRKAENPVPDTEPEPEPDTQGPSATTSSAATEPASKKRKVPKQTVVKPVAEKSTISRLEVSGAGEGSRPSRARTAPLQFWKNEKVSYKVAERDQTGLAVSLTADVVRVEDTPVAQKKKARPWRPVVVSATEKVGKRMTKSKRKSKNIQQAVDESSSESEGDESEDDWEKVGKLVGMVRQWNPEDEEDDGEDNEVQDEIATSRHGIQFKPIFGSDYLFAKTLGKEFMGCGILELQTGASKKLKSSGKMQLIFYVLKGKVEAEVNELGFRISHGGQFQVPRGNMYKICNPFKKTARIFFAQACIPEAQPQQAE